jgi:hypothetical protein
MHRLKLFTLSSKFYRIWTEMVRTIKVTKQSLVAVCITDVTKHNLVVVCITEVCPNHSRSSGYANITVEERDTRRSTYSLSQGFPLNASGNTQTSCTQTLQRFY